MTDEVKTEEEAPVIKYTNLKGDEIEISEDDLNEEEINIVKDFKNVQSALKTLDENHLNSIARQCAVLSQNLLSDKLTQELLKRDEAV